MRSTCLLVFTLTFVITGCVPPEYLPPTAVSETVQAAVETAQAAMRTPSPTPTRTPIIVPTIPSLPTATGTSTPTRTPTQTPAPTLTGAPLSPNLTTTILSCDLGFDVSHGMGEIKNAYVRVSNSGGSELTNVCVILNASNEGRPHPDKSHCFASLRANYEVTTKLTVDTQAGSVSLLEVATTTNQGLTNKVSGAGCRASDTTELDKITPTLNVPRQIQGP